jgi:hypothetical protein
MFLSQVVAQLAAAARMAQATQGFALDLPDALSREPEFLADFFQCVAASVE